jgi:hypothetical protein
MKRILISCVALAAFAAPAFAAEPDGSFVPNTNSNSQGFAGGGASAIIQNGQFVSGNCDVCAEFDQTTAPGSRADAVHAAMEKLQLGNAKPK